MALSEDVKLNANHWFITWNAFYVYVYIIWNAGPKNIWGNEI